MKKSNVFFWINVMRIFAWAAFFVIIIGGGIVAPIMLDIPMAIVLFLPLSLIAALLFVILIMIFLNIAKEAKEIKEIDANIIMTTKQLYAIKRNIEAKKEQPKE